MFAYLLGFFSGAALPIQTSINAKLNSKLGSAFLAVLVSFTGATVFLTAVLFIVGEGLNIPFDNLRGQPIWILSGGLLGVILVTFNVLLLPRLGSVETVIIVVFGQIAMSLMIDGFGWLGAKKVDFSLPMVIGAVLVSAGVIATSYVKKDSSAMKNPSDIKTGGKMIWRFCGLLGGFACACQVAVNSKLTIAVESVYFSSFISFATGTITMVVLCIVLILAGKIKKNPEGTNIPNHWWMWVGGIFGAVCVYTNSILAPILGTALTVIVSLIGQICGGVIIDLTGFLGANKKKLTVIKFAGIVMMITGAALIQMR